MQYRWDDYCLDRHGSLLTRGGVQIDISRRHLDCITCLIEQRHRVVTYDELIHTIWGHGNVSNHQLAQVVLTTRRALGDNGQAQRLIRNMPGLGYRWVSPIAESDESVSDAVVASVASGETPSPIRPEVVEPSPRDSVPASQAPTASVSPGEPTPADRFRKQPARWIAGIALSVLALSAAGIYGTTRSMSVPPIASSASTADTDPIAALETLLNAGRYEDVRQGLATLPTDRAESPQAKLLEVYLDIARGRIQLAHRKLDRQQLRADAVQDPLWRARIMAARGELYFRDENRHTDVRPAAESALVLLGSMGDAAPPKDVGEAIILRAIGFSLEGRLDEAMRDYVKAKDIFVKIGDRYGMGRAQTNLARVWVRKGQLREALDELQSAVVDMDSGSLISHIALLNTISQIQAELLNWDEALATNDEALRLLRQTPESGRRRRTLMIRAFILSENGRLHEAAAQLEEAAQLGSRDPAWFPSVEAIYDLASGNPGNAQRRLQRDFRTRPEHRNFNMMLEDGEGLLLLWTIAARDLAAQSKPVPDLTAAQQTLILDPKTATGQIARGRWLWSQGDPKAAESDMRLALRETQRVGHRYRMTLAGEALIELLLQRGDAEGAELVLEEMQGHLSTHADRDYRTSLLALRVALARKDTTKTQAAYQRTRSLAGERSLPADITKQYTQLSVAHRSTAGRIAALADDAIAEHLD